MKNGQSYYFGSLSCPTLDKNVSVLRAAGYIDKNEYADQVASWKRFSFPRIRERLPTGMIEDFDKNCAMLLNFPSLEDFKRSPMMTRR